MSRQTNGNINTSNTNLSYQTIAGEARAKIIVQRSIFIALAREIADEDDCRTFLSEAKKTEPRADHYPYAYRIGADKSELTHYNDHGEPGGTAGRPILGALQSAGVVNAMIVVARYFGGKKLGIPGLIEAYRAAADAVLAVAGIAVREPVCLLDLDLPYDQLDSFRRMAKTYGAEEINVSYDTMVRIRLNIPLMKKDGFRGDLAALGLIAREI